MHAINFNWLLFIAAEKPTECKRLPKRHLRTARLWPDRALSILVVGFTLLCRDELST